MYTPDYNFLMNMWLMNRLTVTQVDNAAAKGYITIDQGNTIKNTPRTT